jgi:hypothetical protein
MVCGVCTESLENDVKQLQQRIQSLITRFHQIDPEDHRKLEQQAAAQAKVSPMHSLTYWIHLEESLLTIPRGFTRIPRWMY